MKTTTGDIEITIVAGKCRVKSPYHPDFVASARGRNGRWVSPHWVFDARDEAGLREECRRIYGTDGTPVPCVDCRVDVYDGMGFSGPEWVALGRILVKRPGRDDRVRLGEGVVVIEGGFPAAGGSVKNPRPDADSGTILEVRDVPAELARRWADDHEGITILELDQPDVAVSASPSPSLGPILLHNAIEAIEAAQRHLVALYLPLSASDPGYDRAVAETIVPEPYRDLSGSLRSAYETLLNLRDQS